MVAQRSLSRTRIAQIKRRMIGEGRLVPEREKRDE